MTPRRAMGLIASVAALLAGTLPIATASATTSAVSQPPASAPLSGLVSQTPVAWTPNIYPGSSCGTACKDYSTVFSTVVVNGEVVVAGAFSAVCSPVTGSYAQCPNTVTADFIFAFDPATGAIDPNFRPVLNAGPIYSLAAGPNNTVYIGGSFTTVNATTAGGVAQLYVTPGQSTDGTLVPGFAGQTNGTVTSLVANGNALYIGGLFSKVDGVNSRVARLSASTGALDSQFQFTLSNPAHNQALQIKTMSLSPDGSVLGFAGTFLTVNGQSRPRLALVNTGGGFGSAATLANWAAPILTNDCTHQHNYINGIDFSPDGSYFVIADTGFQSGTTPGLCDAVARFATAATGTNVQPTWVNYSGGDTFRSVTVAGSVVYVGGHERWLNNECGNNRVCEANAVLVNGVGAIDANTGLALPWWQPQTGRGRGVESLTTFPAGTYSGSNGGLILGTDVHQIAGAQHYELAIFPLDSSAPQVPGGPIPSGMFSQGRPGGLGGSKNGVAAMCVDDTNDSSAPGNPVELQTCSNDAAQNWTIQPDSTIQINGLCLDTSGGGTADGTLVVLNTCTGATSQHWQPGGASTLVNQASGTCLDDPGASTSNGTQLQILTCDGNIQQVWPLPVAQAPPPPPPSGPVYSALVQSSDGVPCLTDSKGITTQGTPVIVSSCEGLTYQRWTIESNGTIQFKGKCLDTSGSVTVLNRCSGSASQVWQAGSNYSLVNQGAGMCLYESSTSNGTQLQIAACNGSTGQQWRLPAV